MAKKVNWKKIANGVARAALGVVAEPVISRGIAKKTTPKKGASTSKTKSYSMLNKGSSTSSTSAKRVKSSVPSASTSSTVRKKNTVTANSPYKRSAGTSSAVKKGATTIRKKKTY